MPDPLEERRKYKREWQRTKYAERRSEWFAINGPCVDCASWDELEVDHVDASTKVTHNVWRWSRERREAELAKCVARCFPCHRRKTIECQESPRGSHVGTSKLTEDQVREIRRRYSAGETQKQLGAEFGVTSVAIHYVVRRITWAHLEDDPV